MAPIQGVYLQHIARETHDPERLAAFYEEVLGFKRMETPSFGSFPVIWMSLPPSYSLHLIGRDSASQSSPPKPASLDPSKLPRSHHVAFSVADYDAAVSLLKEKGIETFEKTQQDGKIKQAFFFDPEGNGIEIGNWPPPS